MKMNPVSATMEVIMTILGPYRSAAHPFSYTVSRGRHEGWGMSYHETKDTTGRATIAQGRLPVGRDRVANFRRWRGNTESAQKVGYLVSSGITRGGARDSRWP